ncbi:acyl-CoA reductase-like NAD-dependent aldehyde dehydrogenase [Arthrobacter pascens]|nr:acyl-CoA reductase-like NAD-dependent aldehyde dehydrogenase [Arthrobacter pascens]
MAADVRRAIAHIHRRLHREEWPLRLRRQALERAGRLLTEQLSAGTKALRIGPKLDRGTDVGPLISEAEARRVEEWV